MITGVVTADREATIRLAVRGPADDERVIEAVIDNGFNGWLSLPPFLTSQLDLPWRQRARARLADGSERVFDIYEATVIWDGQPRRVPAHEADTAPLLGMSLLDGYELIVQVRPAGNVTIRVLP